MLFNMKHLTKGSFNASVSDESATDFKLLKPKYVRSAEIDGVYRTQDRGRIATAVDKTDLEDKLSA
jgi:Zinc knuckle